MEVCVCVYTTDTIHTTSFLEDGTSTLPVSHTECAAAAQFARTRLPHKTGSENTHLYMLMLPRVVAVCNVGASVRAKSCCARFPRTSCADQTRSAWRRTLVDGDILNWLLSHKERGNAQHSRGRRHGHMCGHGYVRDARVCFRRRFTITSARILKATRCARALRAQMCVCVDLCVRSDI